MNEPAQSPGVVLAVVVFIGTIGLGGLAGIVFLIWSGVDPSNLIAVSSVTTTAVGGLVGLLAMTRSGPPAKIEQAQAQGYQQAVADVTALGAPAPAPIPGPVGVEPGTGDP